MRGQTGRRETHLSTTFIHLAFPLAASHTVFNLKFFYHVLPSISTELVLDMWRESYECLFPILDLNDLSLTDLSTAETLNQCKGFSCN